jgi:hypothetical protein
MPSAWAQFSATVTGTVVDPSGAVVPGATVKLTNDGTGESRTATSNSAGVFTFPSLAPGNYHLLTTSKGFASSTVALDLQTNQTLNIPVKLAVSSSVQTVNVSTQAPLLNTADNRIQETISQRTLSQLPLAGESMISLVTLAPGVTGRGVTGNGSPGSGVDNYSTETQVDASANGQGAVGNMYIVDGLDVTSSIRPGVLNLTPSPDAIQETSIQTNTYSVLYGRASSIQMTMTTKSGTEKYHGNFQEIFTNNTLTAGTHFTHNYPNFHTNNISASVGGPFWPKKRWGYFFFEIEPQRGTNAVAYSTSFEDPAFTTWAKANYPNTVGTKLLSSYSVSNVSNVAVQSTAADIFPGACGTAATNNLPCSTPMIDTGNFSSSAYRNGNQYFIRIDKNIGEKDRLYGTVFRTTLTSNGPNVRSAFNTTNKFYQWAIQANETHTFSPNTINEAAFAADRVEGITPATGLFSVPVVGVSGVTGFGDGFAQGDFIQHNYHWRDMLTHLVGNHDIQIGTEGLFADDIEIFNGPYDQPNFSFDNLLQLAQDDPTTEGGLAYNPLTGQRDQWNWNAAGMTFGAFAQDTWKITPRLTLNYGIRWDDFGNPWSRSAGTAFGNFFLGPGQTYEEEVANGSVVQHNHALSRAITDIFSPRAGLAWDIAGNGNWLLKAGAGMFHNWPTMANLQEEFRGNPPGDIFPTFYRGGNPAPIFAFGTSNQVPFNFPAPTLPARQLNQQGGINGLQFGIGAIDPTLTSPVTYTYSAGLAHRMARHYVASIDFSGANGRKLLSGGGQVYNVSYGQDINVKAGDLIDHASLVPTRLNQSFGSIYYTKNDRVSNYAALILAFKAQYSRSLFSISYTHSRSWDDTQVYPSYINVHQWYGPSIWNAPNRLSILWNYDLPTVNDNHGALGRVASGWVISGTGAFQSGNPLNVFTSASFQPSTDTNGNPIIVNGHYVGYGPNSGDYNADGDNNDYPDVANYSQGSGRSAFLHGIFSSSQFSQPTFGQEGNEKYNRFVGPSYKNVDVGLLKNTKVAGSVNAQFRFEVFNVLNLTNLTGVDTNLADSNFVSGQQKGNFGKATSQQGPRLIQIGVNVTF